MPIENSKVFVDVAGGLDPPKQVFDRSLFVLVFLIGNVRLPVKASQINDPGSLPFRPTLQLPEVRGQLGDGPRSLGPAVVHDVREDPARPNRRELVRISYQDQSLHCRPLDC
ncbi:hypothetical protein D9M68_460800 [compost metagenome]